MSRFPRRITTPCCARPASTSSARSEDGKAPCTPNRGHQKKGCTWNSVLLHASCKHNAGSLEQNVRAHRSMQKTGRHTAQLVGHIQHGVHIKLRRGHENREPLNLSPQVVDHGVEARGIMCRVLNGRHHEDKAANVHVHSEDLVCAWIGCGVNWQENDVLAWLHEALLHACSKRGTPWCPRKPRKTPSCRTSTRNDTPSTRNGEECVLLDERKPSSNHGKWSAFFTRNNTSNKEMERTGVFFTTKAFLQPTLKLRDVDSCLRCNWDGDMNNPQNRRALCRVHANEQPSHQGKFGLHQQIGTHPTRNRENRRVLIDAVQHVHHQATHHMAPSME